ncbi:MAG: hypothetical protein BWY79_01532 [Actinobacteria bacterium ADurb.Bin444]|nr:MAG: hypothetical protein BWY79_01532 [Actinobacteria bacterium ADurb.Bin444]
MVKQRIEVDAPHSAVGRLANEDVDPLPRAKHFIHNPPFGDRPVGSGGVDPEGGFAVEPAVSTAETGALRRDDADVIGREALT